MELREKLKKILDRQKEYLTQYEEVLKDFEGTDIINQNEALKQEVDNYKKVVSDIKQKYNQILAENQEIRTALNEQILDEKLSILKSSKEKIKVYFDDVSSQYNNSLYELKESSKAKIDKLKEIASKELIDDKDNFNSMVDNLYVELNKKITEKKNKFEIEKKNAINDLGLEIDKLSNEELSQEVIAKRIKQNNLEIKVGLGWVNKIGMFLILLGVAAALQYSYVNWFQEYMKGIFSFVIGAIFLVVGEFINKKGRETFAKGLTGGGIAILYYAVFSAYFVFGLVNMGTGFMLSVLVTLVALILSLRHNSKTICAFSLIGGYLPFFAYAYSFNFNEQSIFVAMAYLFILNLLILSVSLNKSWSVTNYISFVLNVPTLIYLVFETNNTTVGITYSIITFLMYLTIILAYPFKNKISLKSIDTILLGLNTFISCIIIYALFEKAGITYLRGLLAVMFCFIYLGLGQFISKYMSKEKYTQILFYLTSFTFAILIVPFQFGVQWLSLGWFVEGILMIIYGYKNKLKNLEMPGWIIYGLCLYTFFTIDVMENYKFFEYKYFSIVAGSIIILYMYLVDLSNDVIQKYSKKGKFILGFKYFTIINTWIYLVYISNKLFDEYIKLRQSNMQDFYTTTMFAIITAGVALGISKSSLLYDKVVKYISISLYIITDTVGIFITLAMPLLGYNKEDNTYLQYFAVIILFIYNLLMFFNVKDILMVFIEKSKIGLDRIPLIMAIYLIGAITGFLNVQFRLEGETLIFSLIYVALSFIYIMFGFKKRYVSIRRFGLGLSIFATAKLFIYDLSYLSSVGRIVAYFCFGFVLLAISYIYQKLSSSLETKN